jgi:hypothetical protein
LSHLLIVETRFTADSLLQNNNGSTVTSHRRPTHNTSDKPGNDVQIFSEPIFNSIFIPGYCCETGCPTRIRVLTDKKDVVVRDCDLPGYTGITMTRPFRIKCRYKRQGTSVVLNFIFFHSRFLTRRERINDCQSIRRATAGNIDAVAEANSRLPSNSIFWKSGADSWYCVQGALLVPCGTALSTT